MLCVIERAVSVAQPGWLALRSSLWPGQSESEHLAEMAAFLAEPERFAQFVAYAPPARPIGFAEASLRRDHVNGTDSSPVGFLEGIYVMPAQRRSGVAARLLHAVEAWVRERGCREFASDALLENEASHSFHQSLGFEETERVVYFRKTLR